MEMDLRVLHQEDVPRGRGKGGDHDGQALRETESRVGRKVEARVVRSPQAQRHGVRPRRLLQIQGAAWKECAHTLLDLPEPAGRRHRQYELGRYGFVPAPMQHAHRVLAPRAHDVDHMRIFERIRLLRRHPFGSDVRQALEPPGQGSDGRHRYRFGGQQVSQGLRSFDRSTVDGDPLDGHGHVAPVPLERPAAGGLIVQECNLEAAPAEDLVDDVRHRPQPHAGAVEGEPRRPFVFTYGLVQQHERLKHRRLAGGVETGEKRERRQRKPQPLETLEETQIKPGKHRILPRTFPRPWRSGV